MNRLHTLSLPHEIADTVVQIVGNHPVLLSQHYDIRQYWLSFVQAVVISAREPPPKRARIDGPQTAKRFAAVADGDRALRVPQRDVAQLVLPFKGWRRVTSGEHRALVATQYPGWERTANGALLTVDIKPAEHADVAEFCVECCRGRYRLRSRQIHLERMADYVLLKIAYGA